MFSTGGGGNTPFHNYNYNDDSSDDDDDSPVQKPKYNAYLKSTLIHDVQNAFLDFVQGKLSADGFIDFALTTKIPEEVMAYVLNQTVRSYLFISQIYLPHKDEPKQKKKWYTYNPLNLKNRIKSKSIKSEPFADNYDSFFPLDPAPLCLGFLAYRETNIISRSRYEDVFIERLHLTPEETVQKIVRLLMPFSDAYITFRKTLSTRGYRIEKLNYDNYYFHFRLKKE